MHKSRLAGFIIDCKTDDLTSAATFWGGALGMEVRALPADEGNKYVRLVDPQDREAPTGQRFCVVRAKGSSFATEARTWE